MAVRLLDEFLLLSILSEKPSDAGTGKPPQNKEEVVCKQYMSMVGSSIPESIKGPSR
jgi:hypothetical protein